MLEGDKLKNLKSVLHKKLASRLLCVHPVNYFLELYSATQQFQVIPSILWENKAAQLCCRGLIAEVFVIRI